MAQLATQQRGFLMVASSPLRPVKGPLRRPPGALDRPVLLRRGGKGGTAALARCRGLTRPEFDPHQRRAVVALARRWSRRWRPLRLRVHAVRALGRGGGVPWREG